MSLLTVILLLICTCTYVRSIIPSLLDKRLGKVGALSGSVQELVKERAHTWQSAVFSWLSVSCFGPKTYTQILNDKDCIDDRGVTVTSTDLSTNKKCVYR